MSLDFTRINVIVLQQMYMYIATQDILFEGYSNFLKNHKKNLIFKDLFS